MANNLETTEDWMEFYKTRQKELFATLRELDPHDKSDWMINEVSDLATDADQLIRMLCKRTRTLTLRIQREFSNENHEFHGR